MSTDQHFTFQLSDDDSLRAGARALVADHLKAASVKRPLVVTDRGIAPLPMLQDFVASLSGLSVGVFSGIWGNPCAAR
jgi:alcohol dehydrogenase class IV